MSSAVITNDQRSSGDTENRAAVWSRYGSDGARAEKRNWLENVRDVVFME